MGQYEAPNRQLPISPLMDEKFYEARQRHRQPKLNIETTLTPLQKAVRKNVYAHALATPLRKCRLTGVILPRFFLLDFQAIANPTTGIPWYMPRSLTSNRNKSERIYGPENMKNEESPATDCLINQKEDVSSQAGNSNLDAEISRDYDVNITKVPEKDGKSMSSTSRIGGGTYLLRSFHALDSLRSKNKKASKGVISQYFLTQNIRMHPFALETFQSSCFRSDMADFVLTLKRRRLSEALILVTKKYRGYIAKFNPTKSLKTSQVAAVLILGPPLTATSESQLVSEIEFRSYMQKAQENVPVFDLRILLGDEMLRNLKSSDTTRWNSEILTIKNKNYSQPLLIRLWELEGYLTPIDP
ncbi:putative esterase-like protein [Erysiphe neolycopersici]|uniref:Putative esterase-like protein n=1 Tax=Erysiphe neolycopersici TaxID=212602 RepID=A0A420HD01_9PEZI|nr:putative esterase-like protein [Erysiphe neolycopersici]